MSTLQFDRDSNKLTLLAGNGSVVGMWDAANNVDSHSEGIWPDGTCDFDHCNIHADDAPDSAYGSFGIIVFDVPGRTGMGVHSGREDEADGLGRVGYQYCTMGCVRTTDAAMEQLIATNRTDPITTIEIT